MILAQLAYGCGIHLACESMACGQELTLFLEHEQPLADGEWRVTVSMEDGTVQGCTLPVEDGLIPHTDGGCLMFGDEDGRVELVFARAEGDLRVQIAHDDQELYDEGHLPDYEEHEGSCGAVCLHGTLEVSL